MLIWMFILSTIYWLFGVAGFMEHLKHVPFTLRSFQYWSGLMNALLLTNVCLLVHFVRGTYAKYCLQYVLTDGVVIWRAWVLCFDDYPKTLILNCCLLGLTFCGP